ncbi:MAG: hypothetical protein GX247_05010 [Mollicutes bacterium]|nr:hypothetical protein [Mollicutes bacterium]
MNLKKIKIISTIGIFLLSFLTHYLYKWFPNDLFAIFFPVNESIWEHMKMLFTTVLLYSIIEYFLLHYFKIKHHNFFWSIWITATLSIIIYLTLYMPFYYLLGNNKIIIFSVLIITIILIQLISYYILNSKNIKLNYLPIILIIISYIIFGYLTYYPPKNELFFDFNEEKYGINNYNI